MIGKLGWLGRNGKTDKCDQCGIGFRDRIKGGWGGEKNIKSDFQVVGRGGSRL